MCTSPPTSLDYDYCLIGGLGVVMLSSGEGWMAAVSVAGCGCVLAGVGSVEVFVGVGG